MVYTRGEARIRHTKTGEEYTIQSEELDWENAGGSERSMGPELYYIAIVPHKELGDLRWELTEYPVGVENFQDVDVGPHQLLENFDIGIAHESDHYESERIQEIESIVEHFLKEYEDPAVRTPYESKEGGYQYIWGGPYSTIEALEVLFPDASQDLLDDAADAIEEKSDGDTWVPVPSDPDDIGPFEPPDDIPDEWEGEPEDAAEGPPDQKPGLSFSFTESGLISISRSGEIRDDEFKTNHELVGQLQEISQELLRSLQGTNSHASLLEAATTYDRALQDAPISIDKLYSLGIRVTNMDASLRREVDQGELPDLPAKPRALFETLVQLHGAFIASTDRGRTLLENARQYAADDRETAEDITKRRELASAVRSSTGAFDEADKPIVADILEQPTSGPHPDRSSEASYTTQGNLLTILATGAVPVCSLVFGAGFLESIPGAGAVAATTVAVDGIWLFVTTHISLLSELAAAHGPDLNWVRQTFEAIRRRVTGQDD